MRRHRLIRRRKKSRRALKKRIYDRLEHCGTLTGVAEHSNMPRRETLDRWMMCDPHFNERCEETEAMFPYIAAQRMVEIADEEADGSLASKKRQIDARTELIKVLRAMDESEGPENKPVKPKSGRRRGNYNCW